MKNNDVQGDVGEGQLAFGQRHLDCTYTVTFTQEGRRRTYQQVSGTVIKTNQEWKKLHPRTGIQISYHGAQALLHLADGQVARGYVEVKDFGPGAPGRSVLRFFLVSERPRKPTG